MKIDNNGTCFLVRCSSYEDAYATVFDELMVE